MGWFFADDQEWHNDEFVDALVDVSTQPYRRITSGPPLTGLMFGSHEEYAAAADTVMEGPQMTVEEIAAWAVLGLMPGFTLATIGAYLVDFALWRHPAVLAVTAPAASANVMLEMGEYLDTHGYGSGHQVNFANIYSKTGTFSGGTMPVITQKWW